MYTCPIELSEVRYNAATQHFEALVTVHDNTTARKYACAIPAPITMPYEAAAKGLSKQAIRRHQGRGGLFSNFSNPIVKPRSPLRGFDPRRWLRELMARDDRNAA